ncbi:ABC transporter permease [Filibacter tadaridae]|uniref:ABC-2 family transporter protein n=1 Tax=Filibacter tadaridae TaxID=2483811 RepID=A0A3P5WT27_9BACL|nr:ABC transporter permease [Filibacter tadaridae]VDC19114.1 ABC-2 family transporter protein [Filibacter tadaridae]
MGRLFQSEFLKLRRSSIWLLIFVSPILSLVLGLSELSEIGEFEQHQWTATLGIMTISHAILFLPLLTGIFSSFICRYEHVAGGWKQLLSLPVSRRNLYIVKILIVSLLIAATQILFILGLFIIGWMKGYPIEIPWGTISTSVFGGWLACMPLIALQMFASVAWSSFAAPLAVNVIFTIPNMLIVNSERFGPYYPWSQPFLMMMPNSAENFGALNVSIETLFIVIFGSLILFLGTGLVYFLRKEI